MSNSQDQSIDRRKMLQGSVALGLSASWLGCQQNTSETVAAKPNELETVADTDRSRRVYIVEPNQIQGFYSVVPKLNPRPRLISWTDGRLRRQDEDAQGKPKREFDFLIWASQEEAEGLRAHESIKSVIAYRADLIVESGDRKNAKGKLAVSIVSKQS